MSEKSLKITEQNKQDPEYDPFEHRTHDYHPTSDFETALNLINYCMGTGILVIPYSYSKSGLWFGFFGTLFIGYCITYGTYLVVKCSHILCRRKKVPCMSYPKTVEAAFTCGPESVQRFGKPARRIVTIFLFLNMSSCCCVYIVFIATNIQKLCVYFLNFKIDVRIYMTLVGLVLIPLVVIKRLKNLTPIIAASNFCFLLGIGIVFYYITRHLQPLSSVLAVAHYSEIPIFFGIQVFSIESIGVAMLLENHMKNPKHFIHFPGILPISMAFVVMLNAVFGFFGYLTYGENVIDSITLNMPNNEDLSECTKIIVVIGIFFTYALTFHLPAKILYEQLLHFIEEPKGWEVYCVRVGLLLLTVIVAVSLPFLGLLVCLFGAFLQSTLGLIIPAIVDILTYMMGEGFGQYHWRLSTDILIIVFGIVGLLSGIYISILQMVNTYV